MSVSVQMCIPTVRIVCLAIQQKCQNCSIKTKQIHFIMHDYSAPSRLLAKSNAGNSGEGHHSILLSLDQPIHQQKPTTASCPLSLPLPLRGIKGGKQHSNNFYTPSDYQHFFPSWVWIKIFHALKGRNTHER